MWEQYLKVVKFHQDVTSKLSLLLARGKSMIAIVFSFSLLPFLHRFYHLNVILGNIVTICNTRYRTSLGDEEAHRTDGKIRSQGTAVSRPEAQN